jgi:hypothetical protein
MISKKSVLKPLLFIINGSGTSKRFEHFFAGTANRTNPFFRKFLERGALGNLGSAITSVRVIDVSTIGCLALKHFLGFCHGVLRSIHTIEVVSKLPLSII